MGGAQAGVASCQPARGCIAAEVVDQPVGIAIERKVLTKLDFNSAYAASGRTVQNRLGELAQARKERRDRNTNFGLIKSLLPTMTPAGQSAYFDRMRIYGEEAAMNWVVGKYNK